MNNKKADAILMQIELGKQYHLDDEFMASARSHQSRYRRDVLKVECDEYGNMLNEDDGKRLLNYYPDLGVPEILRKRYPGYSKMRDSNLLRSEHIPFNMFGPMISMGNSAIPILNKAFDGDIKDIIRIEIEFAPEPKEKFLNDGTSFDAYIEYENNSNVRCAYGIEVKYTEHEYAIGQREKVNINNEDSKYWRVTKESGFFRPELLSELATDKMRQIWRNHLLGLAMVQSGVLAKFKTVTIYPNGNKHFQEVLPHYKSLMLNENSDNLIACTFEQFFESISGNNEIMKWKQYLSERYLINHG